MAGKRGRRVAPAAALVHRVDGTRLGQRRSSDKDGAFERIPVRQPDHVDAPLAPPRSLNGYDLLARMLQYGLKERPYDETDQLVAPNAISSTPDSWRADKAWDSWILNPSVDAKISFNGPPQANEPFIKAGIYWNVKRRARAIHYQAQNAQNVGTLSIWLARWRD